MDTSHPQFSLIVAYLLPGFIALGGVALLVPSIAKWLQPVSDQSTLGIGAPVYAVLAATTLGMIVSCFRWLFIDHIMQFLGVGEPVWDTDRLEQRLNVFNYFVEYHYRYYQFYSNTVIAFIWTYVINRWLATSPLLGFATDIAVIALCIVLLAGARDALKKYYQRTNRLIGPSAHED